jgi:hypothetical protein
VLVIVDPLMAFLAGDVNSHRDQDVRRALAPLSRLAEKTGAAVVVVRHLNKATGGSAIYRGGGSIGIVGAARSGLLVAKHPEDDAKRVLASIKNNLSAPAPSLVFGLAGAESGAVRVTWKGETSLNAAALLSAPTDPEERSAGQEAQDFLRDILSGGPRAAADVRKQANEAGVAWRTVERAKATLGVQAKRKGEAGKQGGGAREWALPAVNSANPEGWRPKTDTLSEGPENPAYVSKNNSSRLTPPNASGVKSAEPVGGVKAGASANPAVAVRALLASPPGWLGNQVAAARREGFPERLLKPLAAAISTHLYGTVRRDGETLPAVEAYLTHGVGCECEECS